MHDQPFPRNRVIGKQSGSHLFAAVKRCASVTESDQVLPSPPRAAPIDSARDMNSMRGRASGRILSSSVHRYLVYGGDGPGLCSSVVPEITVS